MSAQQAYRADETQGHAEQTVDQWMQATKDKASSAHDMACDAANSATVRPSWSTTSSWVYVAVWRENEQHGS
ncbi:hypothetical protein ACHQM5_010785 [Ranunculus cassubicifolius]